MLEGLASVLRRGVSRHGGLERRAGCATKRTCHEWVAHSRRIEVERAIRVLQKELAAAMTKQLVQPNLQPSKHSQGSCHTPTPSWHGGSPLMTPDTPSHDARHALP
jgi:hypothetical protein